MKKEDKILLIKKFLKAIFFIFVMLYLSLFIMDQTGYYTFSLVKQKNLTEEQIKKFEEDIKAGVDIDLEEYIKTDDKSYQNNVSSLGLVISNGIGSIVNKCVNSFFGLLNDLLDEDNI